MIRLRGHHLICLHFYRGEGYPKEYSDNLKDVVDRACKGEEIEVVYGSDDICWVCPYLREDRCSYKEGADEEIKRLDLKALRFLKISPGGKAKWRDLKEKVISASKDWFLSFCEGCDWESYCSRF